MLVKGLSKPAGEPTQEAAGTMCTGPTEPEVLRVCKSTWGRSTAEH